MKNKEILQALKRRRKCSEFARFLNISVQGLYKLLNNEHPTRNQYGNYILFLRYMFES
jgi:hypothetical protein